MAELPTITEQTIIKSQNWCRLAICINHHLKNALIRVLHNDIKDTTITGLPSDPSQLFTFMMKNINTLDSSLRRKVLKKDQHERLLPHGKMVDSGELDITLIRYLIRTFSGISNLDGNWKEPRGADHSIAAAVFRAADIRNVICHYNNITSLEVKDFEDLWNQIECVLADLSYAVNITELKTTSFDPAGIQDAAKQFHANMAEDFENILYEYKEECKKIKITNFVERQYIQKSSMQIISSLENLIQNHDSIMVSGEAGLGKTSSAKHLRFSWAVDRIFKGKKLLYIDSKRVIKELYKPSYAAPICVSELRDVLDDKTDEYLASFGCVKKTIKDLIVVIDGVDELSIVNSLDMKYIKNLQIKIDNNELISGMETIVGIYFGFFFPRSTIIVFGRKHEIDRLKDVQNQVPESNLFNTSKRAEIELQPLSENGIKELINRISCNLLNCECIKCHHIYQAIKDVDFRNIPSHLVSFIKVFESLPNKNIGKMTKSKLFLCTLFNLLKNHSLAVIKDVKTFKKLLEVDDAKIFTESIRSIAKMSFLSLLNENVTIQLKECNENNIIYLEYEQNIRGMNYSTKIEREILEKIDLFYIRDYNYYYILEPYHLTNMEFLSACYIFCHKDEWELLLEIKSKDRLLIILSYLAGLHADDYFTRDFTTNVLSISNCSIDQFFSSLYNIQNVRERLPYGGRDNGCWYGFIDERRQSLPFYLLDSIHREIETPELFIPKTIVCYCDLSFEWYNMQHFKHNIITKQNNLDKLNIETFLDKFDHCKFIIKGDIEIGNIDEMKLVNKSYGFDRIKFRISHLIINESLAANIHNQIKLNILRIWKTDSRTVDMLLSVLSPPTTTSTTSKINVKRLHFASEPTIMSNNVYIPYYIHNYNAHQTKQLVKLGLCGVDAITLNGDFLTSEQLGILKKLENKHKLKQINFRLGNLYFNCMFMLPYIGTRHISVYNSRVNSNNLIQLKTHLEDKNCHHNNFEKYKLINPSATFIRKEDSSTFTHKSFYLHLNRVEFDLVSSNVFASTISYISTFECDDDSTLIPSSHWKELARTEDCRMNELRVWTPTLNNLKHFIKIQTNTLQLVCDGQDELKVVLGYIAKSVDIQLDKVMKVYVVKCDVNDWDYYDEIVVFSGKRIEEFKNNHTVYNSLLDKIRDTVPYYEGEQHLKWWCCEIRINLELIGKQKLAKLQ